MNNQNNAAPCPGVDPQGVVADVIWRIDNEAAQFIDKDGMVYLRYLRYLRDLLANQRPAPTGVYAAKVERLIKAAPYIHDSAVTNTGYGLLVELILTREELDEYRAALAALAEGE